MKLSLNNFLAREKYLQNLIDAYEKDLRHLSEGTLRITSSNNSPQFLFKGPDDSQMRYLSKEKMYLAAEVAQRKYEETVIQKAKEELLYLGKMIRRYAAGTVEDIYESLAPARRELVTPFWLPDDEYVKQWLDDPYEGPGFSESDPVHYTDSGIRVRSKSEVLITQRYCERNVPFKYEKSLYLNGWGWVSPDYHLLNVRLRKEYIHEHLGMMDDIYYANQNIGKVHAYEKNGYIPGKNLILTFETKQHPINLWEIDEIIDQYLL